MMTKESKEEIEAFICENKKSYEESYQNLEKFLKMFIEAKDENIHHFVQTNSLNFSYEKMMSALRLRGECPSRMKLILLGVNLNMSLEQIYYMLSLAYMSPMCAKDNVECVIMYAVESAFLINPAYSVESAIILQHYKQNPVLQEKCKEILNKYWNGNVYAIEPPLFVELEVIETEPGFAGNTAQGATKPATVETGAQVMVPLFVNQGDKLKIDTRTGEYLSRV